MNRRFPRATTSVVLLSGCVAACVAPIANADSPTAETPTPAQLATLNQSEVSLLDSGTAIVVVMDPSSGDILSVAPADPVGASPNISNHAICNSGDGCYITNHAPYADEGFYGSAGTYYGSWPYRSAYSSGSHTVSACWISACGPQISPGSKVTFTSDVTGSSFTIS